ncbi:MFS transporter [Actinoallomurus iriomotensis]|uniref:MFS transporter n=1 Tax=Actinoallomurus iriomotensis TaxID=478107 RepID=A0A9W6RYT3_9ACTN|nr:MFS transporter [Actinoallomurus iriomotensis]GLY82345.1 MFS transporter [Actinoallomurus iriomotensis]
MSQQTVSPRGTPLTGGPARHARHPGISLAVIVACQLMVVLDATVVFVALPKIQLSLHFSATGLSWVSNAYSLTFGGLLLLGGRAGDILGRRRVFVTGIAVFTLASLAGGFATSAAWLLAARAVQGAGAALAAPGALALITTNFAEGPERNRALSIFSATSSAGASVGLILGGVLTDWASWRWVLFVNVPVGALVLLLAPVFLEETERHRGRLDLAGAVTSVTGMVALVYAFIRAADAGWGDTTTLLAIAAGVVLLAAFVAVEARAAQPVVPLRLFADRARAGAYSGMLLLAAAMFGMFFFLVQFLQNSLGFSPLKAGLAFLPMTGLLFGVARLAPRLVPRFGARRLMLAGLPVMLAGMGWLTRLSASSGYAGALLGPLILFGVGAGIVFLPLTLTILSGVRREDSGAASGLLQTMQQVGGALGMAVLVSVFGTASRHGGAVHGTAVAFTVAAAFVAVALAVAIAFIRPVAR